MASEPTRAGPVNNKVSPSPRDTSKSGTVDTVGCTARSDAVPGLGGSSIRPVLPVHGEGNRSPYLAAMDTNDKHLERIAKYLSGGYHMSGNVWPPFMQMMRLIAS